MSAGTPPPGGLDGAPSAAEAPERGIPEPQTPKRRGPALPGGRSPRGPRGPLRSPAPCPRSPPPPLGRAGTIPAAGTPRSPPSTAGAPHAPSSPAGPRAMSPPFTSVRCAAGGAAGGAAAGEPPPSMQVPPGQPPLPRIRGRGRPCTDRGQEAVWCRGTARCCPSSLRGRRVCYIWGAGGKTPVLFPLLPSPKTERMSGVRGPASPPSSPHLPAPQCPALLVST